MPFDGYQPEQPKLEEWQRVLLRAADIIEHCGWTQGKMEDWRGYCAAGAIYMAQFGRTSQFMIDEAYQFEAMCSRTGFRGPKELARWNDTICRSSAQVVGMLRARAFGHDPDQPTYRNGSEMRLMSAPGRRSTRVSLSGTKAEYLWIDNLNAPVSDQVDAVKYVMQSMLVLSTKVVSNQYAWV